MQPVPVDLILHALAENLIGMEGDDESLRTLGHTILRTCVDLRALPAQWCNGAGVGQQMSWLTRRLEGGDCAPNAIFVTTGPNGTLIPTGQHVAAETRAMEVAISRRLADTALSLLVTQDDGDKTAALTLLEAAHRVVGLPSAEVQSEDTTSWQSRVLALEGQLKAAVDTKNAWALEANSRTHLAEKFEAELKGAAASLLHMHKERDAARDEANALRQKVGQLDAVIETNKRLQQAVQSLRETLKSDNTPRPTAERLTWIARFNNGNGGASITLDGRTVLVTGKMADDLAEALHPRRQYVADLKDKVAMFDRDAWMPWARNLLGVDDGTAQELQACIAKKLTSHELRFNLNMGLHKETEAWSAWAERTSGRHNPTAPHARQVIERRIGDMAAVLDALKLDREASHEDIIETIKNLQADRAKLCALVCGDNDKTIDAPVDAPRFKIGDRVLASPSSKYAKIIDEHRGLFLVDSDGSATWLHPDNMRQLPKVDP